MVVKFSFFRDITLCSPLEVGRHFGETWKLATCFMLVSGLSFSSALKMEERCPAETSVKFQWTLQCSILEERNSSWSAFEYTVSLFLKFKEILSIFKSLNLVQSFRYFFPQFWQFVNYKVTLLTISSADMNPHIWGCTVASVFISLGPQGSTARAVG